MGQIEVVPVSGGVGVEVQNINIKNGLDAVGFNELRAAFVEHGLIFLRDQDITPGEHIAFAERWGAGGIRYSMLTAALIGALSSGVFWWAGRGLREDLASAQSASAD